MNKKFECLKCHHQFESDDQKEVSCPKCGSDNVRPCSKTVGPILFKIGLFFLAAIIGFTCVKMIKGSDSLATNDVEEVARPSSGQGPVSTHMDDIETPVQEISPQKEDIEIQREQKKIEAQAAKVKNVPQPVTLSYTYPKASQEGTYSFQAKAEHLPSGVSVTEFKLQSINDNSTIATSSDGSFTGIPFSPDKGQYNLLASLSDGQLITKDRIGGFVEVKAVDNRMKAEELTVLLNQMNKDLGLGRNPKVIRKPVIVVNDTENKNNSQIKIIDDIYGRLELGTWESVTVTSVEYDSHGRIVKFFIDYKE